MTSALTQIHEELTRSREQIRRRDHLRRRLALVEIDLRAQKNRLETLRESLKQEEADVRRLEGLSLPALFATMLGNKEKQLSKERQEALAARLKYDEASFAIDALAEEERACRQQLENVADAEQRYRELLDRKETALKREDKVAEGRLVDLANRVGACRADLKELEEAQAAGLKARHSLDLVIDHLQKAENWGSWDMWGGGWFATSMKHSHLDHARDHAHAAQQHLRAFHRESQDVGERLSATLEMGTFLNFADWFFDGLLVDWLVQTRIQESLAAARKAGESVRGALGSVDARLAEERGRLSQAEEERRAFLEES